MSGFGVCIQDRYLDVFELSGTTLRALYTCFIVGTSGFSTTPTKGVMTNSFRHFGLLSWWQDNVFLHMDPSDASFYLVFFASQLMPTISPVRSGVMRISDSMLRPPTLKPGFHYPS